MSVIDYSDYSLEELNEARNSINKVKYPENYKALLKEFDKRAPEIQAKKKLTQEKIKKSRVEELTKAKKRVYFLGIIQFFAAFCLLFLAYKVINSEQTSLILLALIFLFALFNAICAYTLLTKQKKWYWLSLVNQGLQIPNIAYGKLVYSYTAVGTLFVGFNWPGFEFHITALLNPGFQFHYLSKAMHFGFVGIDILAIVFFFAILTVLNVAPDGEVSNDSE